MKEDTMPSSSILNSPPEEAASPLQNKSYIQVPLLYVIFLVFLYFNHKTKGNVHLVGSTGLQCEAYLLESFQRHLLNPAQSHRFCKTPKPS